VTGLETTGGKKNKLAGDLDLTGANDGIITSRDVEADSDDSGSDEESEDEDGLFDMISRWFSGSRDRSDRVHPT
jgi:hypothetical protein